MPDVSTVKLNGTTIMTVNDTTATAGDVAEGQDFYAANGTKTRGTVPISSYAYKSQLAPIEVSPAENAHDVGDFIVYGNDLCIVTAPIAVNGSLVEDVNGGGNYKVVAVGGKLTDLAASLAPIQQNRAPAADDYSVGDLMVVNGKLYYALVNFDEGMDYVVTDGDQYDPTNVSPTTIADRINSLWHTLGTLIVNKADKSSPSFTGNPTAPTPSSGDNDTSIATTAFVQGEIASKANLASPAFTGNPTVPTQATDDSSTKAASTALVDNKIEALGAIVRPNLLDNWYFVGGGSLDSSRNVLTAFPINQRGATSYTDSGIYTIDRWKKETSLGEVSLASAYYLNFNSTGTARLRQIFDNELPYGIYTLSILFTAVTTAKMYFKASDSDGNDIASIELPISSNTGKRFAFVTFTGTPKSVYLQATSAGGSANIIAVKLERGTTQTLAQSVTYSGATTWQLTEVPNFQQELAKCQRYQVYIKSRGNLNSLGCGVITAATLARATIYTPVPMVPTVTPTVEFIDSTAWNNLRLVTPTGVITPTAINNGYVEANSITLGLTISGGTANTPFVFYMNSVTGILISTNL